MIIEPSETHLNKTIEKGKQNDSGLSTSYNSNGSLVSSRHNSHSGIDMLLKVMMHHVELEMESTFNNSSNDDAENPKKRKLLPHFNADIKKSSDSMSDIERWSMMLETLIEFGKENGHCNVPNSYECLIYDTGILVKLGTWLSTQRQLKRKNLLRPDREAALQRLVDNELLNWTMPSIASPDDEKWNLMYNLLAKYGEERGHCNVPYSYDCFDENGNLLKLGAWLRKQREQKKKGNLKPDRQKKLQKLIDNNQLRMPFSQINDDDRWDMMTNAIELFGESFGHCNVPFNYEFPFQGESIKLGHWLRKQRENMKNKLLTPEKEDYFQSLIDKSMLAWGAKLTPCIDDVKWNSMFDALNKYYEIYGNCNITSGQEFLLANGSSVKLGAWLSQQRHHKRKGKLRPDREEKLQKLVDEDKLHWGAARIP